MFFLIVNFGRHNVLNNLPKNKTDIIFGVLFRGPWGIVFTLLYLIIEHSLNKILTEV